MECRSGGISKFPHHSQRTCSQRMVSRHPFWLFITLIRTAISFYKFLQSDFALAILRLLPRIKMSTDPSQMGPSEIYLRPHLMCSDHKISSATRKNSMTLPSMICQWNSYSHSISDIDFRWTYHICSVHALCAGQGKIAYHIDFYVIIHTFWQNASKLIYQNFEISS